MLQVPAVCDARVSVTNEDTGEELLVSEVHLSSTANSSVVVFRVPGFIRQHSHSFTFTLTNTAGTSLSHNHTSKALEVT